MKLSGENQHFFFRSIGYCVDHPFFFFLFPYSFLDKKAACFAIGGALKAREWSLLKCEIECCNGGLCKDPTLTQDAITVFTPKGKFYILI